MYGLFIYFVFVQLCVCIGCSYVCIVILCLHVHVCLHCLVFVCSGPVRKNGGCSPIFTCANFCLKGCSTLLFSLTSPNSVFWVSFIDRDHERLLSASGWRFDYRAWQCKSCFKLTCLVSRVDSRCEFVISLKQLLIALPHLIVRVTLTD